MLWSLDQRCDGRLALRNCTRDVITRCMVELLPASRTVVEVLEGRTPDAELIEACRYLKQPGYLVALDDISSIEEVKPYVGIAELVKVDFRLTDRQQQKALARWFSGTE